MSLQAIESLKHFAGKANELQRLRDRVQELEELLGLSNKKRDLMYQLKLSPQQAALLSVLFHSNNIVRRDMAYIAIFGARPECEQPDDKILDVQLSRIRATLSPLDVSIETHRSIGWFMTPGNKEKLRSLLDGLPA